MHLQTHASISPYGTAIRLRAPLISCSQCHVRPVHRVLLPHHRTALRRRPGPRRQAAVPGTHRRCLLLVDSPQRRHDAPVPRRAVSGAQPRPPWCPNSCRCHRRSTGPGCTVAHASEAASVGLLAPGRLCNCGREQRRKHHRRPGRAGGGRGGGGAGGAGTCDVDGGGHLGALRYSGRRLHRWVRVRTYAWARRLSDVLFLLLPATTTFLPGFTTFNSTRYYCQGCCWRACLLMRVAHRRGPGFRLGGPPAGPFCHSQPACRPGDLGSGPGHVLHTDAPPTHMHVPTKSSACPPARPQAFWR